MNDEHDDFNLDDAIYVGSFYVDGCDNYDEYYDECLHERVGFFKDKKGNRIDIYLKEFSGNEPHIHLRNHLNNVCRIKLRKNEYQRDANEKDGNPKYRLSRSEEEMFSIYMHSKADDYDFDNWTKISRHWNEHWRSANPGKSSGVVDTSKGCPDYINIKEPKQ